MTFTIVTAASSNHQMTLQGMLWTIAKFEPAVRAIAWDIGMTAGQHAYFSDTPPFYLAKYELRTFDFTKYPAHFNLAQNAGRMAFRPTTILAAAKEFGGIVLWMDAGTHIWSNLNPLRKQIARDGIYCPCTPGTIGAHLWTSTFDLLGATPEIRAKPLRDAGTAAFDTTKPEVMALMEEWAAAALDPLRTAPNGSDRKSHRQDAVFSALMHKHGFYTAGQRLPGYSIKKDNVSLAEAQYRSPRLPKH